MRTIITCFDSVGLTIDRNFNKVQFEISERYSNQKIKQLCVNKLNEIYNPKYPFFFINIADILDNINCIYESENNNIINLKLIPLNPIYKLKFIGLCNSPVYYITSGLTTFGKIVKTLFFKYVFSGNISFVFNDIQLDKNTFIKDCNFELYKINEINSIKINTNNLKFDYSF